MRMRPLSVAARLVLPEIGLDRAVELDGQWIAEAILGGAGGDANPTFADAILFHVCLFDPLEANAHAALQYIGVIIGTVGIGGEAVRRDISHCKSFWLDAHVSGLP